MDSALRIALGLRFFLHDDTQRRVLAMHYHEDHDEH